MSLRTKINGFTAWVNLRLTPYNQLLNNVLMDILSGTHMKYFVESFTGRDLKRLENMDGLSQQQMETRVGWVVDELKKCSILPEDTYVDSRLFAMRSADHVFDMLWRLISHDIWFLWERAEYLQVEDMDVLTQVPFKWTPDPPPKKKKSKKSAKKSLLSGFGASAVADDKSEDESKSASESAESNIDFETEASGFTGQEILTEPENISENELDHDRYDNDVLLELYEEYLSPDLKASSSNISASSIHDSTELSESRIIQCYNDLKLRSRSISLVYDSDQRLQESIDDLALRTKNMSLNNIADDIILKSIDGQINSVDKEAAMARAQEAKTRLVYQNAITDETHDDGDKKLIKIIIEPLEETISETDLGTMSNPFKCGTQFLMANYRAQSRGSSVSSLKSTDAPIKSAPNLAGRKIYPGHVHKKIRHKSVTQPKKLNDSLKTSRGRKRIKSATGKLENSPYRIKDKRVDTPKTKTRSTKSTSASQINATKARSNSKMSVDSNGRSNSQMSFYEYRSTSGASVTSVGSSKRKFHEAGKKKKRSSFPTGHLSTGPLRIIRARGLCGNYDCSLCLMAKYMNQRQDDLDENWVRFPNAEYVKHFKKKKRDKADYPSPDECVLEMVNYQLKNKWDKVDYPTPDGCVLEMVNYQLKTTRDGKGLFCYSIDDFVDSRVLCALVNSFVPNTFTADLLLNDRWTINMALKTAEKMFYAETPFDAEDLVEADPMAVCAYFAFFLMVAYRYRQTTAVVNRVDFINQLIRECNHELEKFPPIISNMQELQRRKDIKGELERHRQAIENIEKKFDVDFSRKWVQHVEHIQNELRREIREKMRQRFDIVEIPRNITINDFCLAAVINLSLTNGSGFYLSTVKEQLSEGRRLVLRHRETGEFIEDFTNKSKATIKETLHLPDVNSNIIEINPANYPNYEFYFEAPSRNKQLKTGTHFLYQVFPGNTVTWQRLFIKSAREAEYETVEKMIAFFREHSSFINCREPKSGNTALHNAARSGHFDIVRLLLENGANIDQKNNFRCTALNFAIEGLQRKICHYLIEWGCDVMSRNIKNQSILETIKNDDFKRFAMNIYDYYSSIVPPIMNGDMALLDQVIADHVSKKREFCCLRSRCINGSTLLHTACYYGHMPAILELLAQRVDVNLRDYKGATPLHRAKDKVIMETLLEAGAHVNAEDSEGNTPLHVKCYGETNEQSEIECIQILLERNVSLTIRNSRGLLPIHCCAMQGRIDVMKMMMSHDQNDTIATALNKEDSKKPPSLLHLSVANDFIECAEWLMETGFHFKEKEPDILMRRILTDQIKLAKRAEALKFLLDNGADANPKYPGGNTALHYAAGLSGPTDVLELLINYGAAIDANNEECCTPLFFSTQNNNQLAACVLIEQGANVRHKNNQGLTAFDHIVDFEEWIECGYFTDDIKARLKAYNLKHSRDLIRAISKKVKPPTNPFALRQEATRSAYTLKSEGGGMYTPGGIPAITVKGAGSAGGQRHRLLPPLKMIEGGGHV